MYTYTHTYTYILNNGERESGHVESKWGNRLAIGESGKRVYGFFDTILVTSL